ncbi:hypothetical protein [Actinomadura litoris]|uniref:Uncharacterized protein n=1 Tax=Actinomadura litoris TaxID=2678616 RepID=A0A7K1KT74_9ACTN|nr:hypothetical protein [Actinomadura litoris]MUN35391.1 hypothetical protein [Actinomadura litoris]
MTNSALDVEPFGSTDPTARIDHLYRLRRATHHFIVRYGEAHWAEEQRFSGRLTAPPTITALPARRRPKALAADEARRVADAHLYGLDEVAATTAVTLGARMVEFTSSDADPDVDRAWSPVARPPAESGLLWWAGGIGYDNLGVPLVAAHWGPMAEGTWLAFWADNRAVVQNEMAQHGWTRSQAHLVLQEFGPLATTGIAAGLSPRLDAKPPPDPGARQPPPPTDSPLALTATVAASWALLTTPGAARLITREPDPDEAVRDRRAGLTPRPATLAAAPIDPQILQRLYTQEQR